MGITGYRDKTDSYYNKTGLYKRSRIRRTVTYHFRVNGHLCKSFAFAPEQRVRLVAEQGLPYSSRRDTQEVTVPQGLHTLLLRPVDHTEHLQKELKPCRGCYTDNMSTIN